MKSRRLLAVILSAAMTMTPFTGMVFATEGSGTDPSSAQLISSQNGLSAMTDGDYVLAGDISINADTYVPVSNFTGTLDGHGYTITWTGTDSSHPLTSSGNLGIVGTNNNGTIKNLKVAGSLYVTGSAANVSLVAGNNNGTIDGVAVQSGAVLNSAGSIQNIGAVSGFNTKYILNSSNAAAVTGYKIVGGISGENAGVINSCFNEGSICGTCSSKDGVGGIAGRNGNNNTATETGKIWNCYNSSAGTVSSQNGSWAGGICGFQNSLSECVQCYNAANVSGYNYRDHIAGKNEGTVTRCYGKSGIAGCQNNDGASLAGETEFTSSANMLQVLNTTSDYYHSERWGRTDNNYPSLLNTAQTTDVVLGAVPEAGLSDIWLSSSGDDLNSGASNTAPVKTLGRAVHLAANGNAVIHVMTPVAIGNESCYGATTDNDQNRITIEKDAAFSGNTASMLTVDGNAVLSGLTIDAAGFENGILVNTGSLALRNGTYIQGAGKGVYVCSGAEAELNRSRIVGNTYSLYSLGTVNVELNNSDVTAARQTVTLGAPVYTSGTFNAVTGDIKFNSSESANTFITVGGGRFNLAGSTVRGSNQVNNVIKVTSGTLKMTSGIITGGSSHAIYGVEGLVEFSPNALSGPFNVSGVVLLSQNAEIYAGSTLSNIDDIFIECEEPSLRLNVGRFAEYLGQDELDAIVYANGSYRITSNLSTHKFELNSNVSEALRPNDTNESGNVIGLLEDDKVVITDSTIEAYSGSFISLANQTYILDINNTLNKELHFAEGATILIPHDITLGSEGKITTSKEITIKGTGKNVKVNLIGTNLLIPRSVYGSSIVINLEDLTFEGTDDATARVSLNNITSGYLKNVKFNNMKSSIPLLFTNTVFDNVKTSNIEGQSPTEYPINLKKDTTIKSADLCEWTSAVESLANGSLGVSGNGINFTPTGNITLHGRVIKTRASSILSVEPQDGYEISSYKINGVEEAIPVEKTTIDKDVNSLSIELAGASTEISYNAYLANVSPEEIAKDGTFTADVYVKSDSQIDAAQINLNVQNGTITSIEPAADGIESGNGSISVYNNTADVKDGYKLATVTVKADGSKNDVVLSIADTSTVGISGSVEDYSFTLGDDAQATVSIYKSDKVSCEEYAAGKYLLKYTGEVADGNIAQYNGEDMLYSEKLGAWIAVIDTDVSESVVNNDITTAAGTKASVDYTGDVNLSGAVTIVDAQIAYDIANNVYSDYSIATKPMWFRADVNGDGTVKAPDARAIQCIIHGITA